MSLLELKQKYTEAKKFYNDGEKPLMTDEEFDELENQIRLMYPNDCQFTYDTDTLAPEGSDKLPIPMPSLKKIKTQHEIDLWLKKYSAKEYLVTAKLDGISAEWIPAKNILMTRYDGINGRDISIHAENIQGLVYPGATENDYRKYINSRAFEIEKDSSLITDFSSLDKLVNNVRQEWNDNDTIEYLCDMSRNHEEMAKVDLIIRGEIMLRKDSPIINGPFRNVCAGIINRKEKTLDSRYLEFIAYEICNPVDMKPIDQIKTLENFGFKVCRNVTLDKITAENLSNIFENFEQEDPHFGYDGVVIYPNDAREKDFQHEIRNSKVVLPEDRRAWKVRRNKKVHETKVIDVEWTARTRGKLVPVVVYEEIEIDGANYSRATGHNAKMINENKIGPGSVIGIIRSNDTIPKIEAVITQTTPKFPDCQWEWRGDVDIYQTEVTDEQLISQNEKALKALRTENVGPAVVKKLFDCGFTDLAKIYSAKVQDFLKLPSVKDKSAANIYNGLRKSQSSWTIVTLMVASQCFPALVGESKLDAMMKVNSDWKNWNRNATVFGISKDVVAKIVDCVEAFEEWYDNFPIKIEQVNRNNSNDDEETVAKTGKTVVFTGVRDKALEQEFLKRGWDVADSVTKKVTLVLYKNGDKKTASHEKAEKYGIKCVEISSFKIGDL